MDICKAQQSQINILTTCSKQQAADIEHLEKGTEDIHMDDCPCTPGIKFIAYLPIWAQELGYTQRFRLHSQSTNGICHFHAVDTVFFCITAAVFVPTGSSAPL